MAVKMLGAIAITEDTLTEIFTVTAGKSVIVSRVILTNKNTSSDATMYLEHLPSGGSTDSKYQFGNSIVLKNNGSLEIAGGICMSAGDKLKAFTDQSSGYAIAWGDEF